MHLHLVMLIFSLIIACLFLFSFFFFNDTATTEIYTLSLHDALPICQLCRMLAFALPGHSGRRRRGRWRERLIRRDPADLAPPARSEEHTSELQSQSNLVCRLLLEKKKNKKYNIRYTIDKIGLHICTYILLC